MGSRLLGLFLFYFFHTSFLFSFLLGCFWFFLGFVFSVWHFLLWVLVGSSLDLRGLVLFVSYLSHGHDIGFHFFFFCRGAQGC